MLEGVTLEQLTSAALSAATAIAPSYADMLWQFVRNSHTPSLEWQSLVSLLVTAPAGHQQQLDGTAQGVLHLT